MPSSTTHPPTPASRHNAALSSKRSGLHDCFKDVVARALEGGMDEDEALALAREAVAKKLQEAEEEAKAAAGSVKA
jgi:hypothetical protein